jgi:hypothetical protein
MVTARNHPVTVTVMAINCIIYRVYIVSNIKVRKIFPRAFHDAMKAYKVSRCISIFILDVGIKMCSQASHSSRFILERGAHGTE